ncbi:uncharacterized protein LOC128908758 [Rissa tridactyla]|uniref:uncharacterized protein LOC128908758 n=1 Tax=Rissa tridactyla TaxID=75485 RepID=UPI0023BB1A76|nr:uncharacterized protein LOC128908758 [Rissa tridactyla]
MGGGKPGQAPARTPALPLRSTVSGERSLPPAPGSRPAIPRRRLRPVSRTHVVPHPKVTRTAGTRMTPPPPPLEALPSAERGGPPALGAHPRSDARGGFALPAAEGAPTTLIRGVCAPCRPPGAAEPRRASPARPSAPRRRCRRARWPPLPRRLSPASAALKVTPRPGCTAAARCALRLPAGKTSESRGARHSAPRPAPPPPLHQPPPPPASHGHGPQPRGGSGPTLHLPPPSPADREEIRTEPPPPPPFLPWRPRSRPRRRRPAGGRDEAPVNLPPPPARRAHKPCFDILPARPLGIPLERLASCVCHGLSASPSLPSGPRAAFCHPPNPTAAGAGAAKGIKWKSRCVTPVAAPRCCRASRVKATG